MEYRLLRITRVTVCLMGVFIFHWGCTPKVAPPYQGDYAREPSTMTRFIDYDNGIKMAIPSGWQMRPLPTGAPQGLTVQFAHRQKGALLQIFCYANVYERHELSLMAQQRVMTVDPDADEWWERRSMGMEDFDPEFEAWVVETAEGLPPVLTHYYLGWKMAEGFGCKYVLVVTVPDGRAAEVEGDFLAMVRSLQ